MRARWTAPGEYVLGDEHGDFLDADDGPWRTFPQHVERPRPRKVPLVGSRERKSGPRPRPVICPELAVAFTSRAEAARILGVKPCTLTSAIMRGGTVWCADAGQRVHVAYIDVPRGPYNAT